MLKPRRDRRREPERSKAEAAEDRAEGGARTEGAERRCGEMAQAGAVAALLAVEAARVVIERIVSGSVVVTLA